MGANTVGTSKKDRAALFEAAAATWAGQHPIDPRVYEVTKAALFHAAVFFVDGIKPILPGEDEDEVRLH